MYSQFLTNKALSNCSIYHSLWQMRIFRKWFYSFWIITKPSSNRHVCACQSFTKLWLLLFDLFFWDISIESISEIEGFARNMAPDLYKVISIGRERCHISSNILYQRISGTTYKREFRIIWVEIVQIIGVNFIEQLVLHIFHTIIHRLIVQKQVVIIVRPRVIGARMYGAQTDTLAWTRSRTIYNRSRIRQPIRSPQRW